MSCGVDGANQLSDGLIAAVAALVLDSKEAEPIAHLQPTDRRSTPTEKRLVQPSAQRADGGGGAAVDLVLARACKQDWRTSGVELDGMELSDDGVDGIVECLVELCEVEDDQVDGALACGE